MRVTVAGRAILALTPDDGRVRVHLVMPGIDRTVEVTGAPATSVHALRDAAARARINPSRVEADARGALEAIAAVAGAWRPEGDASLLTRFGGASYPLLAAAYAAGAGPIGDVPRWADALVASPDPRTAAHLAFTGRATRPVVAALARSLVRIDAAPVDLSRLALALIGRDVLEPDQLATVLTATGPAWPVASLPTPGQLAGARTAASLWGTERTLGYLTQAAADDAARRLLGECATQAVELSTHAPIQLPATLTELRDAYRTQIRTAPAELPRLPVDATRHRGPTRTEDPDQAPVAYGMFHPPRVRCRTPLRDATPIPHPRWLTTLEGTTADGFGFILAHTCGDLVRWARTMANCLDTFGPAAVQGASHLVGVTNSGQLRYVLEIDPDRRIRQFSGRANRAVDRTAHDAIVSHLHALDVLV